MTEGFGTGTIGRAGRPTPSVPDGSSCGGRSRGSRTRAMVGDGDDRPYRIELLGPTLTSEDKRVMTSRSADSGSTDGTTLQRGTGPPCRTQGRTASPRSVGPASVGSDREPCRWAGDRDLAPSTGTTGCGRGRRLAGAPTSSGRACRCRCCSYGGAVPQYSRHTVLRRKPTARGRGR